MIIDPVQFIGRSINNIPELVGDVFWRLNCTKAITDEKRKTMCLPEVIIYLEVYMIELDSQPTALAYGLITSIGKHIECFYPLNMVNSKTYEMFLNKLISLNIKYTITNFNKKQ